MVRTFSLIKKVLDGGVLLCGLCFLPQFNDVFVWLPVKKCGIYLWLKYLQYNTSDDMRADMSVHLQPEITEKHH